MNDNIQQIPLSVINDCLSKEAMPAIREAQKRAKLKAKVVNLQTEATDQGLRFTVTLERALVYTPWIPKTVSVTLADLVIRDNANERVITGRVAEQAAMSSRMRGELEPEVEKLEPGYRALASQLLGDGVVEIPTKLILRSGIGSPLRDLLEGGPSVRIAPGNSELLAQAL